MGDINVGILHHTNDSIDYITSLYDSEFTSGINTITIPNNEEGSCIDHIFYKIEEPD